MTNSVPKDPTRRPEAELELNSEGKLTATSDGRRIIDLDDKFGLASVKDPHKIASLLKQADYKYPLNDFIYFLRRLVQINDERNPKLNVHNFPEITTIARKVKEMLKGDDAQKYPIIGSYAWCFWKLGYTGDTELWRILGDCVADDKFYPNLKEVTFAMEGLTVLREITNQEYIDKVYEKLERNCLLTIWEVNMTYYKRIAESMVQVNRFTPQVFERLEMHVMNNMSMDYELRTMLDILFAFAVSGNGSAKFYNAMQFVIYKGHMFNRHASFYMLWKDTPRHGAFIAKLINTFSIVRDRLPEMKLEPDFNSMIRKLVTNDRANYNLESLVTVMEHIEAFEFEDIKEIGEHLDLQLFLVNENMNADDMIRYLDVKTRRDYGGDYSKLPDDVVQFFDDYMVKNLDSQSPEKIYYYLAESEVRGLLKGKEQLVAKIMIDVKKRVQQYNFEKICYMYWFATTYGSMIEGKKEELKPALSMFKDYIKLYRGMDRDRMQIGSNYYKMLDVINETDLSVKDGINKEDKLRIPGKASGF